MDIPEAGRGREALRKSEKPLLLSVRSGSAVSCGYDEYFLNVGIHGPWWKGHQETGEAWFAGQYRVYTVLGMSLGWA